MSVPQPFAPPPENHIGGMDDKYAREWWRWHFAGQMLPALFADLASNTSADVASQICARAAVMYADALIDALEAAGSVAE
jgi:hypothetical protein